MFIEIPLGSPIPLVYNIKPLGLLVLLVYNMINVTHEQMSHSDKYYLNMKITHGQPWS